MVGRGLFFKFRRRAERVCCAAIARIGGRNRQSDIGDCQLQRHRHRADFAGEFFYSEAELQPHLALD